MTRKNIDMSSIFADVWHRLRAGVNSYVNVFLNICHTSIEAAMPCRSVKGKREEGRREKGRYCYNIVIFTPCVEFHLHVLLDSLYIQFRLYLRGT